jgi:undecaprenyl-diphosphatase
MSERSALLRRQAALRPDLKGEFRYTAPRLLGGGVALYALLAVTGLILTGPLAGSALVRGDHRVSRWFLEHRTGALNAATHAGTMLSDTTTAIVLTAVLVVAFRAGLRRWREALTVLTAISGELFIFLLVTATVHRPRPDVIRLDAAPPTSSFPSGHTGAAVALYVTLAVVLWRLARTARRALAVAARVVAVLACVVPEIVGVSRVYRGMHYPSDVVTGALAGGLWTLLVLATLLWQTGRPTPPNASRQRRGPT